MLLIGIILIIISLIVFKIYRAVVRLEKKVYSALDDYQSINAVESIVSNRDERLAAYLEGKKERDLNRL